MESAGPLAEAAGSPHETFDTLLDVDFIPTEQYTRADPDAAREDARFVVAQVTRLVGA